MPPLVLFYSFHKKQNASYRTGQKVLVELMTMDKERTTEQPARQQ